MPPNTVYVGRPTKWGNPFSADSFGPEWAVAYFRNMLTGQDPQIIKSEKAILAVYQYREDTLCEAAGFEHITRSGVVHELRGKNLACWCPLDQPCHADVLLEIANG